MFIYEVMGMISIKNLSFELAANRLTGLIEKI